MTKRSDVFRSMWMDGLPFRRVSCAGKAAKPHAWIVIAAVTTIFLVFVEKGVNADVEFDRDVAPLLARRCLECHNDFDKKGGLDLSAKQTTLAGGDGGPVLAPGDLEGSPLWQRISDDEMPPEHPLSETEKDVIGQWIASGAEWGSDPIDVFKYSSPERAGYDWWSLQPVVRPPIPAPRLLKATGALARNPIDSFVLSKLQDAGLTPSPTADRRTLIRRLSFDLTGLPPSPDDVQAFLSDESPQAYDRLVERLLASPAYGERWARHWLDVVRFGESQGFERDKLRDTSWRYRDWVVRAFNDDMPYDEFVRLQLAGDAIDSAGPDGLIATGFLVAGPWDEVGHSQQSDAMKRVVRQDELEDYISVVSQTFLGLTVNCARCHDHKFDPVRQSEYYRLAAALNGVNHGEREANVPFFDTSSMRSALATIDQKLARLEEQVSTEPAGEQGKLHQQYTFEAEQLRNQLKRAESNAVYAVRPDPQPTTMHVMLQGNPATPGEAVTPGGVASVSTQATDFNLPDAANDGERRRALAEWITHPTNPLFPRVMVNRLWQFHFGAGFVPTPSDLGFNGGQPTHPELLDWLAAEFISSGYSIKQMHRLIVTSAAYRQSSRPRDDGLAIDADNRWLWRMSPRRLEAESVRDAILLVAGQLNDEVGGPGYHDFTTFVHNTQFYEMVDPVGASFNRRSLYRCWVRSGRSAFLDVFDCPDPSTKTPQRAVTTTPLQSLALLNNSFVLRMSDRLSERLESPRPDDPAGQVDWAFRLAYSRSASAAERQQGSAFIAEYGLPAFCRVLLNTNEFLYVE